MHKVSLKINGASHQLVVNDDTVLLDVLRDDLDLIGAKQSCDRKGQCGACMVIVNRKAAFSCLVKVKDIDQAEVITVEGLGTPDNPHLIQEAFALAGAIQCGYCTPGMIMAAKALLDQNPDPTPREIKKALRRNLCRCTGYQTILQAVQLAGRFLRGETTPEQVRPRESGEALGVSHLRPTSLAKACGTARFTADLKIKGALELAVVRSTLPHAKILSVDISQAEKMPGVVGVMLAGDVPGTNRLKQIRPDQPILCDDRVRFIGDAIAAVAARTRDEAVAAAAAVKVELEPLPVVASAEEAMREGAPRIHDQWPNLLYEQPLVKGDAEAAMAEAAAVVRADFSTQVNHQAPLEPEVAAAYWMKDDDEDVLVIVGRSINIHHHLSILQDALGWQNMVYEEAFTGGQFGIKAHISTEGLVGAAAIHFRRPVRYLPSLGESMHLTVKRHPFRMKVRIAGSAQGKITAYCNDFVVDKGPYNSSTLIPTRALWMLANSYHLPNIKARARMAYTNGPFGGAARGAGAPQATFALECAVDMLAEKLGLDPFELRLNNSLKPGQTKSTGQAVREWPFPGLMESLRPQYERAREEAKLNREGGIKRGVGLGAGSFGIATPGDSSMVAVELDPDGGVSIYAAVADPGEGNDAMLSQLAASVMNLGLDKVRLHTKSTRYTTATGPAAGSRMTYMAGGALVNALRDLKAAMTETGASNSKELEEAGHPRRYIGRQKNEFAGPLDPETGQGPSFESEVHAVQMAEVDVDTETGKVTVVRMTSVVDAGTVINPQALTGQLEGGMDMGVGYALREEFIPEKTSDWVSFKFPTFATSFPMEVIIRQTPRQKGPMGATGVGEMCMMPTAPAVINAIANATGARVFDLPATPEKVKAALLAAGQ